MAAGAGAGAAGEMAFEEDVMRNPGSLKNWWYYLDYKADGPAAERVQLYERAVHALPMSYKLWMRYLRERRRLAARARPGSAAVEEAAAAFERALASLGRMPRLWLEYAAFLREQHRVTRARHAYDRALRALPVTQHELVWPEYLEFARSCGVAETAARVWRRYLRVDPGGVEDFIDFLREAGRLGEAAAELARVVGDPAFVSRRGRSRNELWKEFLRLITRHPREVAGVVDVEAAVRAGMRSHAGEAGRLWNALAEYHTRSGALERARDVYEEGLAAAATVRDFTLVFDAYSRYEEQMLDAEMAVLDEDGGGGGGGGGGEGDDLAARHGVEAGDRVDLRLARLEDLAARRAELLSGVLLRQNPHNVDEWLRRVALFKGDPQRQAETYARAVRAVDPARAQGSAAALWGAFALHYEREAGDPASADHVMEKAVRAPLRGAEELAEVWCRWVEMCLARGDTARALELARRATAAPAGGAAPKKGAAAAAAAHRSTRLWALLADLEESLGSLDSARAVYDRAFELKVVTPAMVLGYARMLEERRRFEEMFRVLERGVGLFEFPHAAPVWSRYVRKFVRRFRGAKVERARDLFEQALARAPPGGDFARRLYLQYAAYEERYGLVRRAVAVYERACRDAPPAERLAVYEAYASRAAEYLGPSKTREVWETALRELPDDAVREACARYAALERGLGEVERARAVLAYGAQFADPRAHVAYWRAWHEFEVEHGNKETFKDMLRVRRTVATRFSTSSHLPAVAGAGERSEIHPNMVRASVPVVGGAGADAGAGGAGEKRPRDPMAALDDEATRHGHGNGGGVKHARVEAAAEQNPDEIALDDDSDSDDGM